MRANKLSRDAGLVHSAFKDRQPKMRATQITEEMKEDLKRGVVCFSGESSVSHDGLNSVSEVFSSLPSIKFPNETQNSCNLGM